MASGLAGGLQVHADDGSAGVALPGLVSQPRGSVRATAAELGLHGDAVVLRLQLQAPAQSPQRALLLRGPMFTWLGAGETYPDRHFPELTATLDGQPLPAAMGFTARAGGRDVSADIAALGLDPFLIATTPPLLEPSPPADSPAFRHLLASRAVQPTEGQLWARWQAGRTWHYTWHTTWPQPDREQAQVFELSFQARPALALLAAGRLARALPLSRYCLTAAQLGQMLATLGWAGDDVVARSYAIAVGIDGGAPRRLNVNTDHAQTYFCGAGGQAAHGGSGPTAARSDNSGVLRLLRLEKAG